MQLNIMCFFIILVISYTALSASEQSISQVEENDSASNLPKYHILSNADRYTSLGKMSLIDLGIVGGAWIPNGPLRIVGSHPMFGFFIGGGKDGFFLDFSLIFKFLDTKDGYYVSINDSLIMTKYFFGGYFAMDSKIKLFRISNNEIDLLLGIGYDGWDTFNDAEKENYDGNGINTINLNAGIGYRLYSFIFEGLVWIISPELRYNWTWYGKSNRGGTDLTGNVITANLSIGLGARLKQQL